jgi:hypothetical protein
MAQQPYAARAAWLLRGVAALHFHGANQQATTRVLSIASDPRRAADVVAAVSAWRSGGVGVPSQPELAADFFAVVHLAGGPGEMRHDLLKAFATAAVALTEGLTADWVERLACFVSVIMSGWDKAEAAKRVYEAQLCCLLLKAVVCPDEAFVVNAAMTRWETSQRLYEAGEYAAGAHRASGVLAAVLHAVVALLRRRGRLVDVQGTHGDVLEEGAWAVLAALGPALLQPLDAKRSQSKPDAAAAPATKRQKKDIYGVALTAEDPYIAAVDRLRSQRARDPKHDKRTAAETATCRLVLDMGGALWDDEGLRSLAGELLNALIHPAYMRAQAELEARVVWKGNQAAAAAQAAAKAAKAATAPGRQEAGPAPAVAEVAVCSADACAIKAPGEAGSEAGSEEETEAGSEAGSDAGSAAGSEEDTEAGSAAGSEEEKEEQAQKPGRGRKWFADPQYGSCDITCSQGLHRIVRTLGDCVLVTVGDAFARRRHSGMATAPQGLHMSVGLKRSDVASASASSAESQERGRQPLGLFGLFCLLPSFGGGQPITAVSPDHIRSFLNTLWMMATAPHDPTKVRRAGWLWGPLLALQGRLWHRYSRNGTGQHSHPSSPPPQPQHAHPPHPPPPHTQTERVAGAFHGDQAVRQPQDGLREAQWLPGWLRRDARHRQPIPVRPRPHYEAWVQKPAGQ